LDRSLGEIAAKLPKTTLLIAGVEPSWEDEHQRLWWYSGGLKNRCGEIIRAGTSLQNRLIEVAGFRLLAFVCGELWDGGSEFDIAKNAEGVDVIVDAAHGSVNRAWDRAAEPWPRCAFQRTFLHLGRVCGGILAQAHEADSGGGYVRRQDNWVVYKGELPFPDIEVIAL
jgi:hypothetical protein